MNRRPAGLLIALGLLVAGCGSGAGTVHRLPVSRDVFRRQRARRLTSPARRPTVDRADVLIPDRLDPKTVDFVRPESVNVVPDPPFPPGATPPGFDAYADAVIARPYHVEVVATGPIGRHVDISWEQSCGLFRLGQGPGSFATAGAKGSSVHRVLAVKLPHWSNGDDSCCVTALLLTSRYERGLAIELVNY